MKEELLTEELIALRLSLGIMLVDLNSKLHLHCACIICAACTRPRRDLQGAIISSRHGICKPTCLHTVHILSEQWDQSFIGPTVEMVNFVAV